MPQVSFIVPVYKIKEEYLRECIDSIVNQTLTDIEILLIDDGSPDNCGEICDEYARKDARVKVFHQSNQGVSAARNKGIAHATGEWITFVDADDWVELDMCESLLAELDENDSETDIVIFSGYNDYVNKCIEFFCKLVNNKSHNTTEFITNTQKLMLKKGALGYYKDEIPYIPISALASSCCKLYQSNFIYINNLEYSINLKRSEDVLFLLQSIDCAKKVFYLHKNLYHYRIRKSSAVRSYSNEFDKHIQRTIEAFSSYVNQNTDCYNLMSCYNYRVFTYAISVICNQYYNKQNYISCSEKWKKSKSLLKSNIYRDPLNNVKLLSWKCAIVYVLIKLNLFVFIPIILNIKLKFSNLNAFD